MTQQFHSKADFKSKEHSSHTLMFFLLLYPWALELCLGHNNCLIPVYLELSEGWDC